MSPDRAAEHAAVDRAVAYLRSWLPYRYPRADVPGYAVAVAHRGAVLLDEAWGWADLETRSPLRPDHVFRVASHSKTFTATAVLRLVEAGRLGLDDHVADHVDWLGGHRDPRMGVVTVRQLLCHGAGVVRDGADADFWQLRRPFPDGPGLRREVLGADLVTDTNVALKYSNVGYSLLGQLIEAVTGETYGEHVRRELVEPLGLASTGPEPDARLGLPLATGYGRPDAEGTRQPIAAVDTGAMAPATGFYATAADLCRWFGSLLVSATYDDPSSGDGSAGNGSSSVATRVPRRPGQARAGTLARRLLGDEAKKEMQRAHWRAHQPGKADSGDDEYGLGLIIDRIGGRRVVGHSGGFPGYITRSIADPATGLVVVVLTNAVDGPATAIARGIVGIVDTFLSRAAGAGVPSDHGSDRGSGHGSDDASGHGGRPDPGLRRLEGRYANLWGTVDVVAAGDGLLLGSPDSWEPFAGAERLEPRPAGRSFRIADTSSYGSAGETVTFAPSRGAVRSVRHGGMTMWPEEVWRAQGAQPPRA